MKHRSTDVTKASNPRLPATHNTNIPGAVREQNPTPVRQPPIEPMAAASGFAGTNLPRGSDPVYRDGAPENLPEHLTANEERAVSRSPRYGNSAIGYEAHPAIEPRDKGISGTSGLPGRDITGRASATAPDIGSLSEPVSGLATKNTATPTRSGNSIPANAGPGYRTETRLNEPYKTASNPQPAPGFSLPNKVTIADIKTASSRYGMGRRGR